MPYALSDTSGNASARATRVFNNLRHNYADRNPAIRQQLVGGEITLAAVPVSESGLTTSWDTVKAVSSGPNAGKSYITAPANLQLRQERHPQTGAVVSETAAEWVDAPIVDDVNASYTAPLVTVSGDPITVEDDGKYNAFPGLAKLADGTLVALYAAGASHTISQGIKQKKSSDSGATWGSPTTIVTGNARDPEVTTLANGHLLLSYFLNVSGFTTVYVVHGTVSGSNVTWGSPIEVSHGFNAGSVGVSSKPRELASGRILLPMHGREGAETNFSSGVAISEDGGLTWPSFVVVASGSPTADYSETNGEQFADGEILLVVRSSVDGYVTTRSINDGDAWSAPDADVQGISDLVGPGRPSPLLYGAAERLFLMLRKGTGDSRAGYTVSTDKGLVFDWVADYYIGGGLYMYASPVVLSATQIGCIVCIERSSTVSDVVFQRFDT